MSLVTWNGHLLLSPGGNLVLGPAAEVCCCPEETCDTCCGNSYEGPSALRMKFNDGSFSGGSSMLPYYECECCDCIQAGLFEEYDLTQLEPPAEPCNYTPVADVCDFGGPEPSVTAGSMLLVLTCEVVDGVAVVTATLTYPLNGNAVWQLVGFNCQATESEPNVLTMISTGACDTVPNEVWVWDPTL